jgi:hypothetical protein
MQHVVEVIDKPQSRPLRIGYKALVFHARTTLGDISLEQFAGHVQRQRGDCGAADEDQGGSDPRKPSAEAVRQPAHNGGASSRTRKSNARHNAQHEAGEVEPRLQEQQSPRNNSRIVAKEKAAKCRCCGNGGHTHFLAPMDQACA